MWCFQIEVVVANGEDTTRPLVVAWGGGGAGFSVCDGATRSIQVRLLGGALSLNVDGGGEEEHGYPEGFRPPEAREAALYAGGLRREWGTGR